MQPSFLMIEGAPRPVAPFSHAVRIGPWLLVTGQMPTVPDDDNAPLAPDIDGQTRQVLHNLGLVLKAAGFQFHEIVFARIYLTHFEDDYAAMNAIWAETFPEGLRPGRTTIGVTALARGARIEIDLTCYKGEVEAGLNQMRP
ncbi:MAG: RidA family protein [Alphaproteobacteria bacterium]